MIRDNDTVTKIRLNKNLVRDTGIEYLTDALLARDKPLEELLLSHNQLSSKGVISLSRALKSSAYSLVLDLSRNQLIGRSGIKSLLDANVPIKVYSHHQRHRRHHHHHHRVLCTV